MKATTEITVLFNAWITSRHNRLKQRIESVGTLNDDAFQETYLAMLEIVRPEDDEQVFDRLFFKVYRKMLSIEYNRDMRYAHPDPLFFAYLRTEDETEQEQPRQEDEKATAKQVMEYVRYHFVIGDYLIFKLRFLDGMSWQGLMDYTGHSSATIARKINGIKEQVKRSFTPPQRIPLLPHS